MKKHFTNKQKTYWPPKIPSGKKILVVGASGGIGEETVKMLCRMDGLTIGAHYASNSIGLKGLSDCNSKPMLFSKKFLKAGDCEGLIKDFSSFAGGLDAIVIAQTAIRSPKHFMRISEADWDHDIFINLSATFYMARNSMSAMKESGAGGRIILFGTESARFGGGENSLAYGVSKMGIECLVKAFAREGAKDNILVNGIRPGYIATGSHERWQKRSKKEMSERAKKSMLKRAGYPYEVAALIMYLLSDCAGFITGEMIGITGGDRL